MNCHVILVLAVLSPVANQGASAAQPHTYYVGLNGSDSNAGMRRDAPIRHIQSALDRASYGDRVLIMPGVYREQIRLDSRVWPADRGVGSPAKMLTIAAYSSRPTIQASERVTKWMPVSTQKEWAAVSREVFRPNRIFKTAWALPPGKSVGLVMEAEDTPLREAFSLKPGSFLFTNLTLYVWPSKNPKQGIEVGGMSSLDEDIQGAPFHADVDYVKLSGLRFRYSNTGYGGSGVALRRFCRVENCAIEWMDWQGLSCWNTLVSNCVIRANGAKGLEDAWTNAIVTGCLIAGNNWRGFSQAGQAAGLKIITRWVTTNMAYADLSGTVISNNWFTTNLADAIWIDTMAATAGRRCRIVNNYITTNGGGIYLECAAGIDVISNVVVGNLGKGIVLRWASSNLIAGNTVIVTSNASSSSVPFHMRADGDRDFVNRNVHNRVVSNFFSTAIAQAVISTGQDGPRPESAYYDNVYAYNVVTNEVDRVQLNVWHYPYVGGPTPYFTPDAFGFRANGWRTTYTNPNVGNRIADKPAARKIPPRGR